MNAPFSACDSTSVAPQDDQPYPEAEEFKHCLEYYRQLLPWYRKQWSKSQSPISANWPRNIPATDEIPALEFDLKFCKQNPTPKCQDLQFRIASFFVNSKDPRQKYQGYKMIKELAEQGHPDGMCLYGKVLNEGLVDVLDANPEEAVVWWRRCVDSHRHIPSMYELAVALYTGEGVPENPELAVSYFHKAANLHVGAAYMLGECLLDGVGVPRHRAAALEWLIVAAELGHRGAQARVLAILESQEHYLRENIPEEQGSLGRDPEDDQPIVAVDISSHSKQAGNRARNVNIERRFTIGGGNTLEKRFTIGGGSRNPYVKQRRHSIVRESHKDGTT